MPSLPAVIAYRDCTQSTRQGQPSIRLSLRYGSRTVHVRDDRVRGMVSLPAVIAYRDCSQSTRQGQPSIRLSLRCGSRTVHVRDDRVRGDDLSPRCHCVQGLFAIHLAGTAIHPAIPARWIPYSPCRDDRVREGRPPSPLSLRTVI